MNLCFYSVAKIQVEFLCHAAEKWLRQYLTEKARDPHFWLHKDASPSHKRKTVKLIRNSSCHESSRRWMDPKDKTYSTNHLRSRAEIGVCLNQQIQKLFFFKVFLTTRMCGIDSTDRWLRHLLCWWIWDEDLTNGLTDLPFVRDDSAELLLCLVIVQRLYCLR